METAKKILIVDDDPDMLEQVSSILTHAGFSVVSAQGQEEGEEALLSTIPDLAILDLMMEQMDSGFVLAHQIKRMYPHTPVIILTAVTAATGLEFSVGGQAGRSWIKADAVLDKPIRGEQLLLTVNKLLG